MPPGDGVPTHAMPGRRRRAVDAPGYLGRFPLERTWSGCVPAGAKLINHPKSVRGRMLDRSAGFRLAGSGDSGYTVLRRLVADRFSR
jgi:hypothetical protein